MNKTVKLFISCAAIFFFSFVLLGLFNISKAGSQFYIDPENGNDTNDGLTTTTAWKTITTGATAARIAPGDIIYIKKSPDPVFLTNATFVQYNNTITLDENVTLDISTCETTWSTDSTYVTTGTSSHVSKQGSYAASFTIGSSFTTGKVGYLTLPSTIDASNYTCFSAWIREYNLAVPAGTFSICLCSDSTGDVPVYTYTHNYALTGGVSSAASENFGSSLPSNINSIALYANSDPGALSVYLDNIFVSNGLTLNSLIGTMGCNIVDKTSLWYLVKSISGNTLVVDGDSENNPQSESSTRLYTYWGNSGYFPMYYRDGFLMDGASLSTTENGLTSKEYFVGGFNFDTGVVDGMTIFTYPHSSTSNVVIYTRNQLENIGFARSVSDIRLTTDSGCIFLNNFFATGCSSTTQLDQYSGYAQSTSFENVAIYNNYSTYGIRVRGVLSGFNLFLASSPYDFYLMNQNGYGGNLSKLRNSEALNYLSGFPTYTYYSGYAGDPIVDLGTQKLSRSGRAQKTTSFYKSSPNSVAFKTDATYSNAYNTVTFDLAQTALDLNDTATATASVYLSTNTTVAALCGKRQCAYADSNITGEWQTVSVNLTNCDNSVQTIYGAVYDTTTNQALTYFDDVNVTQSTRSHSTYKLDYYTYGAYNPQADRSKTTAYSWGQ